MVTKHPLLEYHDIIADEDFICGILKASAMGVMGVLVNLQQETILNSYEKAILVYTR